MYHELYRARSLKQCVMHMPGCIYKSENTHPWSGGCRVRCSHEPDYEFAHMATMDRLQKKGCSPERIYDAICSQVFISIVLPTCSLRK